MYKPPLAIVFDCFGVLYRDAFLDFMETHRHHLLQPEVYYYELCDACDKGTADPLHLYKVLAAVSGESVEVVRHKIDADLSTLDEAMPPLIQELKHRYRIGLISNVSRGVLDTFLADGHLRHLFDSVLASSEVGHLKPEREIFEAMAQRLHIPFDRWLFIDDRIQNIRGASDQGIPSHHFTSANELRKYLQHTGVLAPAPVRISR